MLPTTPTAEITLSTFSVSLLPSLCSITAVMVSLPLSSLATLVSVWIVMPAFSKRLRACAAISSSSTGRICGRISTTVTSAPMVR